MHHKILLASCLSFFVFFSNAQTDDEPQQQPSDKQKKNEVKINALGLIAFSVIDLNYEYVFSEESAFGAALFIDLGNSDSFEGREFGLRPYYRKYFSRKYGKGFFIEGFGLLNTGDERRFFGGLDEDRNFSGFALGVGIGGKWVTPSGFLAELNFGVGRNVIRSEFAPDFVGVASIGVGARF